MVCCFQEYIIVFGAFLNSGFYECYYLYLMLCIYFIFVEYSAAVVAVFAGEEGGLTSREPQRSV